MNRFTNEEVVAMQRLAERAQQKEYLGDLVLNSYNCSEYKVSIARVLRYLEGEPHNSTLAADVNVLFSLMTRSIEVHELTGDGPVRELIDIKRIRDQKS